MLFYYFYYYFYSLMNLVTLRPDGVVGGRNFVKSSFLQWVLGMTKT